MTHKIDHEKYIEDAISTNECWQRLFDVLHGLGYQLVGSHGFNEQRLSMAWGIPPAGGTPLPLEGVAFPTQNNSHAPWIFFVGQQHVNSNKSSKGRVTELVKIATKRISTLMSKEGGTALTPREKQCLFLTSQGNTRKLIANNLGISLPSVDFHLKNAKKKFNARTITHAVALAMQSNSLHTRVAKGA